MYQGRKSSREPPLQNTRDLLSKKEAHAMIEKTNENDPILRIHESRREEAKRDAEMRLEIQKKQLESQKQILALRVAGEEARQKKIRDSWKK
jgi:hypothetical protein